MRAVVALLVVCALAFMSAEAQQVKVLDSSNYHDSVASGVWFIKYYAPWCGHCKRLEPTLNELAAAVGESWNVGKVDCTVERDICAEQEVRGYPTLKMFVDGGEPIKFAGQRTVGDIIAFVEKNAPNVAKTENQDAQAAAQQATKEAEPEKKEAEADSDVVVLTDSTFEQARTGVWLVEFFAPWCGHCKRLAPTWSELATKAKGSYNVASVDVTTEKELTAEFGIRSMPTIKLLVDGKVQDYSGQRTIEAFDSYVKEAMGGGAAAADDEEAGEAPIEEGVYILSDANFDATTSGNAFFVKFYAPWCGHCKRMAGEWSQFGAEVNNDESSDFSIGKVDCTIHKDTCSKFGVRGFPTLILIKADGEQVKYSGAREISAFKSFLADNTA